MGKEKKRETCDWPQDQSNRFGEYRTSADSMRCARHGLLEPPAALPQERL